MDDLEEATGIKADRKLTTKERAHKMKMMVALHELERDIRDLQVQKLVVPADWDQMDEIAPVRPKKERMTARLDADVLRWFRGLGQGYQGRINAVLRAYMHGVISKSIEARDNRDWDGNLL